MSSLNKGSIVFAPLSTLEATMQHISGVTGIVEPFTTKADSTIAVINSIDMSGNVMAMGGDNTPHLFLYDMSGNSPVKLPNVPIIPPNDVEMLSFSADGTLLAVLTSIAPYLYVYNTSDWSLLPALPEALPANIMKDLAWSPDGTKLAIFGNASPYITVLDTSDWSEIVLAETPAFYGYSCQFSHDGTKLALGLHNAPYLWVYDTTSWTNIATPLSGVTLTLCLSVRFNSDDSKIYVSKSSTPWLMVFDTTTWVGTYGQAVSETYGTLTGLRSIRFITDDHLVCSGNNGAPGIIEYDGSGNVLKEYSTLSPTRAVYVELNAGWEINGSIDEALVADTWVATVLDYETSALLGNVEFTGTAFTVPVANPRPVIVTVSAKQGDIWEASLPAVAIGYNVFPTDPISTPYYYVATVAGTTGVTEPVWPVDAGGTVVDGSVTWQRVERLIQPVTQSPLIPTVV